VIGSVVNGSTVWESTPIAVYQEATNEQPNVVLAPGEPRSYLDRGIVDDITTIA
jgi:hypothetical protein